MVRNRRQAPAEETKHSVVAETRSRSSNVLMIATGLGLSFATFIGLHWRGSHDVAHAHPNINGPGFDPRVPRNWMPLLEVRDTTTDPESHRKFIDEEIIAKGVAVVIKGSKLLNPVVEWGISAFEDRCRNSAEALSDVKVLRENGSFLHYDGRNKAMIEQGFDSAQESRRAAYYSYTKAENLKFWKAMRSALKQDIAKVADSHGDNVKLAMTIGVNQLCNGALSKDLADPWWQHFVHPEQGKYPHNPASRNIWMGMPGVTTSWHFDTYTNFFVHLGGSKRMLVLPPSAYYDLYFYPALHPYYRKSQIVWEDYQNLTTDDMLRKFPGWFDHRIQVVTLSPGDILYLPPYWNHRAETLGKESSSSLSFWSSSDESMLSLNFLTRLKQEIDAYNDLSTALDFFQAAMHLLVEAVFPSTLQRQRFFDNLISRQYLRSAGPQFDRSQCRPCEAPSALLNDRRDSAMTLQVQRIVNEMLAELHGVTSDVRPIIMSFVIEKGINKLFFKDVQTDICFMIQCLANHLILF